MKTSSSNDIIATLIEMEEVEALCKCAKSFPHNLNQPSASSYHQSLYQNLNEHAGRLFLSEEGSTLDFLELSTRGKGGHISPIHQLG